MKREKNIEMLRPLKKDTKSPNVVDLNASKHSANGEQDTTPERKGTPLKLEGELPVRHTTAKSFDLKKSDDTVYDGKRSEKGLGTRQQNCSDLIEVSLKEYIPEKPKISSHQSSITEIVNDLTNRETISIAQDSNGSIGVIKGVKYDLSDPKVVQQTSERLLFTLRSTGKLKWHTLKNNNTPQGIMLRSMFRFQIPTYNVSVFKTFAEDLGDHIDAVYNIPYVIANIAFNYALMSQVTRYNYSSWKQKVFNDSFVCEYFQDIALHDYEYAREQQRNLCLYYFFLNATTDSKLNSTIAAQLFSSEGYI